MIRYCHYFLLGFNCRFQLYSSELSKCIGQLFLIIVFWIFFLGVGWGGVGWGWGGGGWGGGGGGVCAVLVLGVIVCSLTNSFIECYFIMMVATLTAILYLLYSFWTTHLGFPKLRSTGSATTHLHGCFCPEHSLWKLDWTCYLRTTSWHVWILYWDILKRSSRLCNWLPLRCFVPRIDHLPPVSWSTFWKSSLRWYWICKFDIMENRFYFVFYNVFTYILMPYNMIILYFHLPHFHVSNSALFLHNMLVLSVYIDVVLTLFNRIIIEIYGHDCCNL